MGTTPSNSDYSRRTGTATNSAARGAGLHTNFLCAKCRQPRLTQGRKLQRVLGLKQYVCRHCL